MLLAALAVIRSDEFSTACHGFQVKVKLCQLIITSPPGTRTALVRVVAYADLVALAVLFFLSFPMIEIMGGVRLPPMGIRSSGLQTCLTVPAATPA
jgi:hypothetical protein